VAAANTIRIVNPVGQRAAERIALARRLATLNGKSIGFIDNIKPNAGLFIQYIEDLLRTLASSIAYVGNRNTNGEGQPLLILCPQHARLLANGGYSKLEVKRFIWETARIAFGSIPRGNLTSFSKKLLKLYADFDPAMGVPIADKPEDIVIVVMGGTGTHSLSVQTRLASENVTVPILRKDGAPWRIST
jgi:hypothetical protein